MNGCVRYTRRRSTFGSFVSVHIGRACACVAGKSVGKSYGVRRRTSGSFGRPPRPSSFSLSPPPTPDTGLRGITTLGAGRPVSHGDTLTPPPPSLLVF